jgi:nucleoside-diphosphate-sugar epimerase
VSEISGGGEQPAGGAGFIGPYVVERFLERVHWDAVVDYLSIGNQESVLEEPKCMWVQREGLPSKSRRKDKDSAAR